MPCKGLYRATERQGYTMATKPADSAAVAVTADPITSATVADAPKVSYQLIPNKQGDLTLKLDEESQSALSAGYDHLRLAASAREQERKGAELMHLNHVQATSPGCERVRDALLTQSHDKVAKAYGPEGTSRDRIELALLAKAMLRADRVATAAFRARGKRRA
jgi:hypothetical protein